MGTQRKKNTQSYVSSGINENELCSLQRKADFLDCGSEDQEGGIQGGRDDSRSIENIHQESHIYSNVTRHRMLYVYKVYITIPVCLPSTGEKDWAYFHPFDKHFQVPLLCHSITGKMNMIHSLSLLSSHSPQYKTNT